MSEPPSKKSRTIDVNYETDIHAVIPPCLSTEIGICVSSPLKHLARYRQIEDYTLLDEKFHEIVELLSEKIYGISGDTVIFQDYFVSYTNNQITYKFYENNKGSRVYSYNTLEQLEEEQKSLVNQYIDLMIIKSVQDYLIHKNDSDDLSVDEFFIRISLAKNRDRPYEFHQDSHGECDYFTLTYLMEKPYLSAFFLSEELPDNTYTTASIVVENLTTVGWANGPKWVENGPPGSSYHASPMKRTQLRVINERGEVDHIMPIPPHQVNLSKGRPRNVTVVPHPSLSILSEGDLPRVTEILEGSHYSRNFIRIWYLENQKISNIHYERTIDCDVVELKRNALSKINFLKVEADPVTHPEVAGLLFGGGKSLFKIILNYLKNPNNYITINFEPLYSTNLKSSIES